MPLPPSVMFRPKKKLCVSGNPTDPIFSAPTLIFWGQKIRVGAEKIGSVGLPETHNFFLGLNITDGGNGINHH